MVQATELVYLHDTYQYIAQAQVIHTQQEDEQRYAVICDRTIFYPQGGGQPYDTGYIYNDDARFYVEQVWLRDGVVHHIGTFTQGDTITGTVTMEVNAQRRLQNARLHTLGHLIDYALHDIGYTTWKPVKGYHFPEGAYVLYKPDTSVDLAEHPELSQQLENELNARIQQGGAVQAIFVSRDELAQYVTHVPDYIPADKPCRVVVYDDYGTPCGGTHVKDVSDIGQAVIRKISKKKGDIKIAYDIA